MENIFEALDLLDTVPEEEWGTKEGEHGKLVNVKHLSFHDMYYYEDGHVEAIYIGD